MKSRSIQALAGTCFAALTLAVLLVAFLPWANWLGYADEGEVAGYAASVVSWLVWTVGLLALAIVASAAAGDRINAAFDRWLRAIVDIPGRRYAWALAVVAAVAAALLSTALFARNPHLVDTIAQLFQARIFAAGSLTAPAPNHFEFFAGLQIVRYAGRWFSQYPPGHPALLAPGLILGVPWLVNPLFGAGTVALVFAAARRLLGEGSARLAAALYLLSPFALFMSASYMNHVTNGFFLALALYAAIRAMEEDASTAWPALTGLALAAAATIRPLESAAWAVVLGVWILTRRGGKPALVTGAACLVGLLPLLAYNALTTGHPLRFGYTLLWGEGHGLGFHTDPWGKPFTPLKSFAVTALDFQRLNAFLFAWPFPSLVFLVAALGIGVVDRRLRSRCALLASLLLAAPFAYFFYWHRDNYLGPRFLYASLIPAVLLTAAGIGALDMRLGRWRSVLRITIAAAVMIALALNMPRSAGVVAGQPPWMKLHPELQAAEAGISEALVFVKVGWGSRLIGRLWGWGVPAKEVEQTYRRVDACRIQGALDTADSLAAAGVESADVLHDLRGKLAGWRLADMPVVYDQLPDRSVRYDTTTVLSERCYREVVSDTAGFTLFGSLLWRDDPWLRDGIIYARDLGAQINRRLADRYTDRAHYYYAPLSSEPGAIPQFIPIAPDDHAWAVSSTVEKGAERER